MHVRVKETDLKKKHFEVINMENTSANHSNPFPSCPLVPTHILNLPRTFYSDEFLITIIVINAVTAFISSCNNFVIIYTITRTSSLQVPSNILVLGLAISDFGVAVIVQPVYCLYKFFEMKRYVSLYCTFGLIFNYSGWTIVAVSLFTLTAIAGDRFLAFHLHLRYEELATNQRYGILLGCIWVISLVICICRIYLSDMSSTRVIGLLLFLFIITLNLFFFLKISQVIRRHSLQIQAQQQSVQQSIDMPRYKKSVNTIYYVIIVFLVCYVPFAGIVVIHNVGKKFTEDNLMLTVVAQTLLMFNGVLNPIIYCWRIREIRHSAMQLFRRSFSFS